MITPPGGAVERGGPAGVAGDIGARHRRDHRPAAAASAAAFERASATVSDQLLLIFRK